MSERLTPIRSSARESFAYYGDREGWLRAIGRHRDSDCLAESNFRVALKMLGGEDGDTVAVERFSHCLVGWSEVILIHPDAAEKIAVAESLLARIDDYPVLDEDDWSTLEFETVAAYWEGMSIRDRVEACRDAGESIFAARHDSPPERVEESLRYGI